MTRYVYVTVIDNSGDYDFVVHGSLAKAKKFLETELERILFGKEIDELPDTVRHRFVKANKMYFDVSEEQYGTTYTTHGFIRKREIL